MRASRSGKYKFRASDWENGVMGFWNRLPLRGVACWCFGPLVDMSNFCPESGHVCLDRGQNADACVRQPVTGFRASRLSARVNCNGY
jgi:hypothetical protein